MKLLTVCTVMLAALAVAMPAFATCTTPEFLLDLNGFDYTFPVPGGDFAAPNNYYEAVGEIVAVNPLYITTTGGNEYTFYVLSDFLATADTVFNFGIFSYQPNSFVGIYEDAGTAFDYGTSPQNATTPGSFVDGTLILGGIMPDMVVTVDLNTLNGSIQGSVVWSSGSQLGNLPANTSTQFSVIGTDAFGVPAGYVWDIDGEANLCPLTTGTEETTWGDIKKLFNE